MPELEELMNDIPDDMLGEDEDQPSVPSSDDAGTPDDGADDELEQPAGTDLNPTDDDDGAADGADDEESEDDEDATASDEEDNPDEDEEDDQEDYFTADEEEEPPASAAPAKDDRQPEATDENSYILSKLNKIAVRIMLPPEKEGGDPVVKTVEVYGYGDLPRDYLGFASPYEAGIFNQAVAAQENKAREAQTEYRQNQMKSDMEAYTRKENAAIAEDLTDLRREGLFPKFKGNPGTKEFNESDGAKEFDKVIEFMNSKNAAYQRAAQNGRAYRHIGFREAFDMLHGPNPKRAEKSEQRGRRNAAKRVVSSRGTKSSQRNVSNKPVQNITDLAGEFEQFVGTGGNKK